MGGMTGEMKGGMKKPRILYIKGFRAIDGRDGGVFEKNYYFQKKQHPFIFQQPLSKKLPTVFQRVPTVGTIELELSHD